MVRPIQPIKLRFYRYFIEGREDECWEWVGHKNGDGYGRIRIPRSLSPTGKDFDALSNRVAWFLQTGEWPLKGIYVLHTCDNPGCVNPKHLFLGTHKDNMKDMVRKGRSAGQTGNWNGGVKDPERCNLAKLNWAKVREIKADLKRGITKTVLAKQHGVDYNTIYDIARGRTWKEKKQAEITDLKSREKD